MDVTPLLPEDHPWTERDPLFQRGMELGSMVAVMALGLPAIGGQYHAENEEDLRLAAAHFGYDMDVQNRTNKSVKAIFLKRVTP